MDTNMDIGKPNSLLLFGDSKRDGTELHQTTNAEQDQIESRSSMNEEAENKLGTFQNKPNGDSSELSRKNLEIEMLRALVARHEAKIFELQEKLIKKERKIKPLKSESEASSELSTSYDRSGKILEQSKNHNRRSRGRPRKLLEVNEKIIRNVNISGKRSRGRPSLNRSLNMSGGPVIKKSRGRPKKVVVSSSGSSKSSICGEGDSMDDEDSFDKARVVESRRSISRSPNKKMDSLRQTRNLINKVKSKRSRGRPKKSIYNETGNN